MLYSRQDFRLLTDLLRSSLKSKDLYLPENVTLMQVQSPFSVLFTYTDKYYFKYSPDMGS